MVGEGCLDDSKGQCSWIWSRANVEWRILGCPGNTVSGSGWGRALGNTRTGSVIREMSRDVVVGCLRILPRFPRHEVGAEPEGGANHPLTPDRRGSDNSYLTKKFNATQSVRNTNFALESNIFTNTSIIVIIIL